MTFSIGFFIWPSKYVSYVQRLGLCFLCALLWGGLLLNHFLDDSILDWYWLPSYLIWVVSCFLFDRSLPMPPISPEYDDSDFNLQVVRAVAAYLSLIVMFIVIFYMS